VTAYYFLCQNVLELSGEHFIDYCGHRLLSRRTLGRELNKKINYSTPPILGWVAGACLSSRLGPDGKLRRIPVSVYALAIVVCILGCSQTDQKSVGPAEKVTIAYSTPPYTVLIDIAQAQGYFRKEGLDVKLQVQGHGKLAISAVLQGKADFATAGETPIMLSIANGEKISIISTIQTSTKSNGIVARKDMGILIPGDLKGKKIAVTPGSVREFFMDSFLAINGISRRDVKVVDLEPSEMADSLTTGKVDAVSAMHPDLFRIQKKLSDKGVAFYNEDIYTQTFEVVAKQEYIRRNPELVRKMLRSLLKAEEFIVQKPADARRIIEDSRKIERNLLESIWSDNSFKVSIDQSLILALEDESRWAIKRGFVHQTNIPDYLDFIYFDGLISVKPDAVRVLR
jgi:sulfonate transport system substrate-binding protein